MGGESELLVLITVTVVVPIEVSAMFPLFLIGGLIVYHFPGTNFCT